MIEKMKEMNPTLRIFSVRSDVFREYGRVIDGCDVTQITAAAQEIAAPADGSVYLPSVEGFEALPIAQRVRDEIFGTLPIQMGFCFGYNRFLNAAEWHSSSELNIAITPLTLILGKRSDIKDGKLDSADMKAFFLPAGTVVEVFATTLHFCPCQVSDEGFRCVVGLPRETNLPLEDEVRDPLLFRKNKWIIAHEKNKTLIERGVVSGIYGENYEIKY